MLCGPPCRGVPRIQYVRTLISSLAKCSPMNYTINMEFEWDQNKSERCFTERGFDFAYAVNAFFDPDRITQKDNRYDYGETRYQLISEIEGRVFIVITHCVTI